MEGKGGCLIERYGGGFEAPSSKVDKIMQRFRPIAPKPVSDSGSGSGSGSADSSPVISDSNSKTGRSRNERNSGGSKKRKASSGCSWGRNATTLPILPQVPAWNLSPATTFLQENQASLLAAQHHCRSYAYDDQKCVAEESRDRKAEVVVGSCVTVENVGDLWGTGAGCTRAAAPLCQTDEETKTSLAGDKSPAFVSDSSWRVMWVNDAYRKMACENKEDTRVGVVTIRESNFGLPTARIALSCKVKVDFFPIAIGKYEVARRKPLTAPCDVWRMDGGDHFVWRLDVGASLSLGR